MIAIIPIGLILFITSSIFFYKSPIKNKYNLGLVLAIFLVSIGSYWRLSGENYYWHLNNEAKKISIAKELKKYKGSDDIIEKMENHLAKDPTSAKGWYLLGRLYVSKKSFDKALNAFSHSYQLEPQKRDYAFQYIALKDYLNHSKQSLEIDDLLQTLQQKFPQDIELLNFIAQRAFRQSNYQLAIRSWQEIIPLVPKGSDDYKWLLSSIEKAKNAS